MEKKTPREAFLAQWAVPGPCHDCGVSGDVAWRPRRDGKSVACPSGHVFPCGRGCVHADCARARYQLAGDPAADGPLELLDAQWVPHVPPPPGAVKAVPTGPRVTSPSRPKRPRRRGISPDAIVRVLETQAAQPRPGSVPAQWLSIVRDEMTLAEVQAAQAAAGISGSANSELRYLEKRGFIRVEGRS